MWLKIKSGKKLPHSKEAFGLTRKRIALVMLKALCLNFFQPEALRYNILWQRHRLITALLAENLLQN